MTERKAFTGAPRRHSMKPRGFDGTDEDSRRIEALIEPHSGTWSMLPTAAVCDRSLGSVTPIHVLAWLCKYRNTKTGACFPSIERIAKDLGITGRSVQRHVEKLIDCGHMVVVPRRNPATGKQTSNAYCILFREARGSADKREACETPGPTVESTKASGDPLIASAPRMTPRVTPASLGATSRVAPVGPKSSGEGDAPCQREGDAPCRGEGDTSCREGATPDVTQNYPTGTNQLNEPVAELDARARGTKPDPLAIELGHIARAIHMPRDEVYGEALKLHDELVAAGFEADTARSILADEATRIPKTAYALIGLRERVARHVHKRPQP